MRCSTLGMKKKTQQRGIKRTGCRPSRSLLSGQARPAGVVPCSQSGQSLAADNWQPWQTQREPCRMACPIPGLRQGGWSWVDASRDDIQVSAAASNGGGDSQRAGSIGEARARRAARGAGRPDAGLAGCNMQDARRICTYIQCDTMIQQHKQQTVQDAGRRAAGKAAGAKSRRRTQ